MKYVYLVYGDMFEQSSPTPTAMELHPCYLIAHLENLKQKSGCRSFLYQSVGIF
ncbi:MAG: hypothetical protein J6Y41_06745 [Bacteroidaceae bacterium]|nr:hypothetical protein [Bacteroidaceae bacterium]